MKPVSLVPILVVFLANLFVFAPNPVWAQATSPKTPDIAPVAKQNVAPPTKPGTVTPPAAPGTKPKPAAPGTKLKPAPKPAPSKFVPRPVPVRRPLSVSVFDPSEASFPLFRAVGYTVRPWRGEKVPIVVIGRNVLRDGTRLPVRLETYVQSGGRVLVLNQDTAYLKDALGFRVANRTETRQIPVVPKTSPLLVKKGDFTPVALPTRTPVELPHLSSWRPLLECAFDRNYSPLMELNYGNGRLLLCTLELESSPATYNFLRRLLTYVASVPRQPRAFRTVYTGTPEFEPVLTRLGLVFEKQQLVPTGTDLLLVGPLRDIFAPEFKAYREGKGRVLYPLGTLAAPLVNSKVEPKTMVRSLKSQPQIQVFYSPIFAQRDILTGTQPIPPLLAKQVRTFCRVLTENGATFETDSRFFRPNPVQTLSLASDWRVKSTLRLSGGAMPKNDPGLTLDARVVLEVDGYDEDWEVIKLPGNWPTLDNQDGEAVFRFTLDLPDDWEGQELTLSLGTVDDNDDTFFNGQLIGQSEGRETMRTYTVPKDLVKRGKNVIAVRLFDSFGNGGFTGTADQMTLSKATKTDAPDYYLTAP